MTRTNKLNASKNDKLAFFVLQTVSFKGMA